MISKYFSFCSFYLWTINGKEDEKSSFFLTFMQAIPIFALSKGFPIVSPSAFSTAGFSNNIKKTKIFAVVFIVVYFTHLCPLSTNAPFLYVTLSQINTLHAFLIRIYSLRIFLYSEDGNWRKFRNTLRIFEVQIMLIATFQKSHYTYF